MILHGLGLAVLWMLLWGRFTAGNIVNGVILAAAVSWLFPVRAHGLRRLRPLGTLRLGARIIRDLVVSSARVVVAVLFPTPARTETRVVSVQLTTRSSLVASMVGNLITLTPGTMTVDADRDTFRLDVHVLGRISESDFVASVLDLERAVLSAVVPEESR